MTDIRRDIQPPVFNPEHDAHSDAHDGTQDGIQDGVHGSALDAHSDAHSDAQSDAPDEEELSFPSLEPFGKMKFKTYCGPTPESNWVIPGLLLVGAFPASKDDGETFSLLNAILLLGITMFVCLQQEYNPRVTENMWRRSNALRPYFQDVEKIVHQKRHEANIVSPEKLSFVHFPIKDCGVSDDDSVLELAKKLVQAIAHGDIIYMHCWGGHGRTGTVVCIMLHLMYGLTATEAMQRCQAVHDFREYPVAVGSPQTQNQRDQVIRVIQKLIDDRKVECAEQVSDATAENTEKNRSVSVDSSLFSVELCSTENTSNTVFGFGHP